VAVGQEADEDRFEELAVGDDRRLHFVQDGVALVTHAGDVHTSTFLSPRLCVPMSTTATRRTETTKLAAGLPSNEPR
jgi:hypothetical protein